MLDNKQLGAIHIAKKEARLSDPEYRNLLFEVAGVASAKYLSDDGYQAVMRAIRDVQYPCPSGSVRVSPCRPNPPQERKIWALWLGGDGGPGLRQYLPQQERTVAYLLGIARRAADVPRLDSLGDLDKAEAHRVIEALKLRLAQEVAKANVGQSRKLDEVPF